MYLCNVRIKRAFWLHVFHISRFFIYVRELENVSYRVCRIFLNFESFSCILIRFSVFMSQKNFSQYSFFSFFQMRDRDIFSVPYILLYIKLIHFVISKLNTNISTFITQSYEITRIHLINIIQRVCVVANYTKFNYVFQFNRKLKLNYRFVQCWYKHKDIIDHIIHSVLLNQI